MGWPRKRTATLVLWLVEERYSSEGKDAKDRSDSAIYLRTRLVRKKNGKDMLGGGEWTAAHRLTIASTVRRYVIYFSSCVVSI